MKNRIVERVNIKETILANFLPMVYSAVVVYSIRELLDYSSNNLTEPFMHLIAIFMSFSLLGIIFNKVVPRLFVDEVDEK